MEEEFWFSPHSLFSFFHLNLYVEVYLEGRINHLLSPEEALQSINLHSVMDNQNIVVHKRRQKEQNFVILSSIRLNK